MISINFAKNIFKQNGNVFRNSGGVYFDNLLYVILRTILVIPIFFLLVLVDLVVNVALKKPL
jgi:hypothetical protein